MEKKQHSAKFLKKRKMMMVLPLLVLPFLTMAFWALGGGNTEQKISSTKKGLNTELPDANLKDESGFDKLSFYKQAQDDSAKVKEQLKNDPYYRNELETVVTNAGYSGINVSPYDNGGVDANTRKVYQKIEELNQQINQSPQQSMPIQNKRANTDVDRLGEMMQMMTTPAEDDPEMNQINTVLDKIMDVQHPERVKEKLRERSRKNKTQVFAVSGYDKGLGETIINRKDTTPAHHNGFYSEANKPLMEIGQTAATAAVIHETQTLVPGATVKLRLAADVYINGILVPKGTFVFGTASLENERLLIKIESIRYKEHLLPVSLSVHDIDGVAGIYIPGSINRDVAKQSTDQSLSSVELISMDPSLKARAAAAGVGAAKSLLSKKVKLVKVTVKAGYKVLLKDNNQQNY